MSGQVTVPLPARRKGRHGHAVGADAVPAAPSTAPAPTPDRIPRVARVLALAHYWQVMIRSGVVRDQAELARLVGVSRARVTQVMDLLRLAPVIQEQVLYVQAEQGSTTHRALLRIASLTDWACQLAIWSARSPREAPQVSAMA